MKYAIESENHFSRWMFSIWFPKYVVWKEVKTFCIHSMYYSYLEYLNPFKPEFTIVIFIYYKPRIAVAILDL